MLESCPSRSRQDIGIEPHTRDSPGPFHVSASWEFSPGSSFSGSLGLSRASLDSAAGRGRQQVTSRELQRQHSMGIGTTQSRDGHREGIHTPAPTAPITPGEPPTPQKCPNPQQSRAIPVSQRAGPRSPHGSIGGVFMAT